MPTLTCDLEDHQPLDNLEPMEGGEEILDESQAAMIVAENGRALRFPQARKWLKGIIADPASGSLYDEGANAFVRRCQDEVIIFASGRPTGLSREHAVSLHRLFLVRETAAFRDVMEKYDREDQRDQQQPE